MEGFLMRWSFVIASVALLLTAWAAQAQTARAANNAPSFLISQGVEGTPAGNYVSAAPPVAAPAPAPANAPPLILNRPAPTPVNNVPPAAPPVNAAPAAPFGDAVADGVDPSACPTPQMIGSDLGTAAGALRRLGTGGTVPLVT